LEGAPGSLVRFHLTLPRLELGGRSFLETIEAERLAGWVELGRGPTRRRFVAPLADRLREPIASPSTADPFPPLTWLLGELTTGVAMTQTGNLNRAFVQGAAPRFGWDLSRPPRTETDLYDLHQIRDLCQRRGLVRRRGSTLSLTKNGRAVLTDTPALWQLVADKLLDLRSIEATAGEAFLALLLDASSLPYQVLLETVWQITVGEGWRDVRIGAPVDRNASSVAMHGAPRARAARRRSLKAACPGSLRSPSSPAARK